MDHDHSAAAASSATSTSSTSVPATAISSSSSSSSSSSQEKMVLSQAMGDQVYQHLSARATETIAINHNGPKMEIPCVSINDLPMTTKAIVLKIQHSNTPVDMSESSYMNLSDSARLKLINDNAPPLEAAVNDYTALHKKMETAKQHNPPKFGELHAQVTKRDDDARGSLTSPIPGAMRSHHQDGDSLLPVSARPTQAELTAQIAAATGTDRDALQKSLDYQNYIAANKGIMAKQANKGVTKETTYVEFTAGGFKDAAQNGRIVFDYLNNSFYFTPVHYQPQQGKSPWFKVKL